MMNKIRKMQTASGGPLYYNLSFVTFPTNKTFLEFVQDYLNLALQNNLAETRRRQSATISSDNRSTWLRLQGLLKALQILEREEQIRNLEAATKAAEGLMRIASPSTYVGLAMGNTQGTGTGNVGLDLLADAAVFGGPNLAKSGIRKLYNRAMDTTIGNFNLSQSLNKNKVLNFENFKNKIGEGSESTVYDFNNGRVVKISKAKMSRNDANTYTKLRTFRNKQPYYIKERVEGLIDNKDGTFSPVVSLKKVDLSELITPDDVAYNILDALMRKKGFNRVPIEQIPDLPGVTTVVRNLPFYVNSNAFRDIHPVGISNSNVFSNEKFYTLDNRLGINSFVIPNKSVLAKNKYKLINLDNDVVPIYGKYKGDFPLKHLTDKKESTPLTLELLTEFKNRFIKTWKTIPKLPQNINYKAYKFDYGK